MLRSLVFGLMLIPLTLVSAANAHGPTRQKVTETVEINAPAAKVWEVIGNFQDLNWHPAVEKDRGRRRKRAGQGQAHADAQRRRSDPRSAGEVQR